MKKLIFLFLAVSLWACDKTHVADVLPMHEDGTLTVARDGSACVEDFELDVTFDNGYWWFNAYEIEEHILQIYWTLDGEIMYNVDFPLTGVGFEIPQGPPCTVCVTYFSSNGCHRKCVSVDPVMCDAQSYNGEPVRSVR